MKKILVISRHEIILASVLNQLYEHNFDSIGAVRDAEAVSFLRSFKPDLVVLAGAHTETERLSLMEQLIDSQSNIPIISFQGGAKKIVEAVNSALELKK
jgi:DNA-binding response OmpR family regulator